MQLLKHFHKLSIHPKNAGELKGLILQLAIQGKLTADWRKQNPELINGLNSAANLLKRIQEEKQKLVKEKKIRKEKKLEGVSLTSKISKPNEWVFTRLGEVGDWGAGATPLRSNSLFYGGSINWFKSGELNNGIIDFESSEKITEFALEKTSLRLNQPGDVLIAMYGATIGKTAILAVKGTTNQAVCACTPLKGIHTNYLHLLLKGLKNDFINQGEGGAQPNISRVKIRNKIFALPPLEEQKEIVRVVEILFKEVEQLENLTQKRIQLKQDYVASALNQLATQNTQKAWQELTPHFSTFFDDVTNIKKLRETILQLAVQGKLTADWRARHPELVSGEHHASELLNSIQKEKLQLIKEKKIKKEKALPPITPEEIPYELPEGWVWCRPQEISLNIVDCPHSTAKFVNEGKACIDTTCIDDNGGLKYSKIRKVTTETFNKRNDRLVPKANDIIYAREGSIGKSVVIPEGLDVCLGQRVMIYRLHQFIDPFLFRYTLVSPMFMEQVLGNHKGLGSKHVNMSDLRSMPVPLIPKKEQKTLIQKVNFLMSLCDSLEKEVKTSKKQLEDLMQSVLREVFEGKQDDKHDTLPMAAEPEGDYEKSTFDEIFESLNYDYEATAVVLLTQERFGFTYGKKYVHKMFSNIDFLNELSVFKELQFQEYGWGMYSPILQKTLENEVFVTYQKLSSNKNTLQVRPKAIPKITKWINAKENKQFVNQVKQMLTIYEQPLIDRKMDRIELLNTVLECMTVLETDVLEDIRSKMKNWKMFEGNYNTKAEKFSENETLHMIHFIKGLKRLKI